MMSVASEAYNVSEQGEHSHSYSHIGRMRSLPPMPQNDSDRAAARVSARRNQQNGTPSRACVIL